ncbi:AI-2E family transporter [Bizionia argentinensis JUB59]|uniref:AI-2E family transporter n=1 Tax=Bizionia argentinensis JUB59 TaxID=1046627 RepID=G2EGJ3_9FLAO|nr:AI-2E family transporter [Bizionia argentinensis]EGV42448.1 AI-2E family transporter [Bizionia argentinensis JUB59]
MNQLRTTNLLLSIIVIPFVFYLLKTLSFIFIPLIFSMFIALLFLPLMRWLGRKKIPKAVSIVIVVLLIALGLKIGVELVKVSGREILNSETEFFVKAEEKFDALLISAQETFGVEVESKQNLFKKFIHEETIGVTLSFIQKTVTMILMTVFFVVLWLAESINIQKVMNNTLLKLKHTSVKTFIKIENDLIKFVKVKFAVSLATGIGTGLACLFFDVSFPIFWGLFAFFINFVQMVGSIVTVVLLAAFAFIELDPTSTLFFFIISITGVQVLFGSILEPIFMGKSFSVNIITVLVMLMLWGYIWGVPGLIMAIPITVVLKIMLEQFESTKVIANLLSGKN